MRQVCVGGQATAVLKICTGSVFHLGGFPVIPGLGRRGTHCSLLGSEELPR